MNLFNFELPIGWNEVSAISTTLAVVVALFANSNSDKQLKKSLQMHEQMKNIELLSKRVEILEKIRNDEKVSFTELKVLFNDEIVNAMQLYIKSREKLKNCKIDEINFWEVCKANPTNGLSDRECDELEKKLTTAGEKFLNAKKQGCEHEDLEKEFKDLCDENIAEGFLIEQEENIEINYYNIYIELQNAKKEHKQNKANLYGKIEAYIKSSIEPIS